jgi:hypothetical protein
MGVPVLLQLHLKNWCCPFCCVASEDRNAYQAIRAIQRNGSHVLYTERAKESKKGLFPNWFTSKDSSSATSSTESSSDAKRARLMLQDSDVDGQPVIRFQQIESDETASTHFPLRRVDRIQLMDDHIVFYAKKVDKAKDAPELLRFSVLLSGDTVDPPVLVPTDVRNELVHHWMVLVEWERQRRSKLPNTDEDDDDEEEGEGGGSKNIFVRQAQQAAHFAQREIELQRTKRDREQRKAKLIQEAGGLKYTAIAMANSK